MSYIAAGVMVGGAVAGSVGGGMMAKGSAKKAGKAQRLGTVIASQQLAAGNKVAEGQAEEAYGTASERFKPYLEGGGKAYEQLLYGLGIGDPSGGETGDYGSLVKRFSKEDFFTDPGYEFARSEGLRGIERGASARGGVLSGATLKALNKFNLGHANQQYGAAWERFGKEQDRKLSGLGGAADAGFQASTRQSGLDYKYGTDRANLTLQNYANQAALTQAFFGSKAQEHVNRGNAAQNALSGVSDSFMSGLSFLGKKG
jgi:hypothetical protein